MQYTIIHYSITYNSICSSKVCNSQIFVHSKNTNRLILYTASNTHIISKNAENKRKHKITSYNILYQR